jgi:hypothetical protein
MLWIRELRFLRTASAGISAGSYGRRPGLTRPTFFMCTEVAPSEITSTVTTNDAKVAMLAFNSLGNSVHQLASVASTDAA